MQLQTLDEISHRKNNFGELNQWSRRNYHKVVRKKICSFNWYIFLCVVSKLLAHLHIRFFMVFRRHESTASSMTTLRKPTCKPIHCRKKINTLFAGLGSVHIVKNCDLGLENAALGLWPQPGVFTLHMHNKTVFQVNTYSINKVYIWEKAEKSR